MNPLDELVHALMFGKDGSWPAPARAVRYAGDDPVLRAIWQNMDGNCYDLQDKGDAGLVCIHRFAYTYAILSGLNNWGYENRWCYADYDKARAGLDSWTGADGTEPTGWHRHPDTGRRVDENGNMYVAM